MRASWLFLALTLAAGGLSAADLPGRNPAEGLAPGDEPRINNMTPEEFLAFHDRLAKQLDTKRYEHIGARDRRDIASAQESLRHHLAGKTSMDEVGPNGRVAVFNAHERVVAIVNDAEGDRVICERRHRVGSHRPVLQCMTVAERERGYRDTQRVLRHEASTTSTY